jgi:hypothetical protein
MSIIQRQIMQDYTYYHRDLFPWKWAITPVNSTQICPSAGHILGTFAAINVITTALTLRSAQRD